LGGGIKYRFGMTNLRFSTNIAVYLSYGIRQLVAIDHKDEVIDT